MLPYSAHGLFQMRTIDTCGPCGPMVVLPSIVSMAWIVSNRNNYVPIRVPRPFTIRTFYVSNGSAVSGNFDIGLYGIDGTKLVSTGSTAQSGTSVLQLVALGTPYVVPPGSYYLGLALDNTTGAVLAYNVSGNLTPSPLGVLQAVGFPLAATSSWSALSTGFLAQFGISELTTI